jgi:predicted permease
MSAFEELSRDLHHAVRGFKREPAFVAGVALTFALAIGATAAMFGLVQRLMLAPPPGIQGADRVVRVQLTYTMDGSTVTLGSTSYPAFQAVVTLGSAFRGVAAVRFDTMTTGRGEELAEVAAVQASGQYFTMLGVQPALGRFFGPGDDELPNGNDVVVLSYAYWQRRFAGARDVVGGKLLVNEQPLTIVGVAPREFNGTELSATDIFVPLTTAQRTQGACWWSNAGIRMLEIVARLRNGVDPSVASAMVSSSLRDGVLQGDRHLSAAPLESLVPGRSARESPQAQIALWLSGVSLVVLLIATANVGTLLLLRSARRRRDVALRVALGASRGRLVRQALAESVLLALVGAAVGLVLSRWFASIVRVTLLPQLAPTDQIIDAGVLLASVIIACGAGVLAGLAPLAPIADRRANLALELRLGGGSGSSGRFFVQHVLVAIQVALCTVLLIGAGLFVRSLQRVQSQDLGFSTAHLLHVTLDFRAHLDGVQRDLAHEEAVRRIAAVPGVSGVTVVQGMPFSSHHIPPISVPGFTFPPPMVQQLPIMYGATPAYLEMMGVTLRQGRLFTEQDGRGAPLVALVNETMARTVWAGRSAVGGCIRTGYGGGAVDPDAMAASSPCREVVGVVRDSRARSLRTEGGEAKLMQYYIPFAQLPAPPVPNFANVHGILVRTPTDPQKMVTPVQRAIQGASSTAVYARVLPYQELLDPQLRSWRLGATLFSALGGLALAIAAVGLFAVVSYLVTQRAQELGVRLALGGTRSRVAGLVVRDALKMAGAGAAVGGLVAMAAAPLVQSMLFETSAREPASVLAAALLLLAVTVSAAALPAWRASRVSPMSVLQAG